MVAAVAAPLPPFDPLALQRRAGWPTWRISSTYRHPHLDPQQQQHAQQQLETVPAAAVWPRQQQQQQQLQAAQQQQQHQGSRCRVLRRFRGHTMLHRGHPLNHTWLVGLEQHQCLKGRDAWHPLPQVSSREYLETHKIWVKEWALGHSQLVCVWESTEGVHMSGGGILPSAD